MADEAQAAVEETEAAVEEMADEATAEADETAVEETEAAVEEMADEATTEADAAVEETEAAVEDDGGMKPPLKPMQLLKKLRPPLKRWRTKPPLKPMQPLKKLKRPLKRLRMKPPLKPMQPLKKLKPPLKRWLDEATEADAAVEETEAAVEEMADEADAAVEETEAAVEEMADEATAEADEPLKKLKPLKRWRMKPEADAAVEEMAEETAEAEQAAGVVDVQAKVAACAACHGADGNSVIPQNPKLAGQVPGFIADQLSKFKSGERDNAIMTAQVANLTDEDMKAIDAHYSAQEPQLGAISEDMLEEALIGEKIFRGGEPSMSISACMSCHGPNGDGIPIRFPRVSGQHAEYLEQTLLAYKSGSRKSDVMNSIAFRLSEQQIKSLALYMHGLK